MPQSILELIFKTSKQGAGGKAAAAEMRELKAGAGELSSGLLGVNLASVGVIGVITGVAAGMKAAVGDTVAYAEQVRDLGRISGASAEDTSRLIQVADDLKVEYGTLQQAAKALAKNGIALTTEELAKASDKYLSYTDAGARAEYATKTFGKAGLELTKILEQGGDALRQMAKEQSGALILSQKQVDAARDLEKAQDSLSDAFMGVKVTVGNAVIPILTDLMKGIDDLINGQERQKQSTLDTSTSYDEYIKKLAEVYKNDKIIEGAHGDLKATTARLTSAFGAATEGQYNQIQAMKILDEAAKHSQVTSLTTYWNDYTKAANNAKTATEKATTPVKDLALDMQELNKQMIFNTLAATLGAPEQRKLAEAMGLISPLTDAATTAMARLIDDYKNKRITWDEFILKAQMLGKSVDEIPNEKNVNIRVNTVYTTSGVDPGTGSNFTPTNEYKWHVEGESAGGDYYWHWNGSHWVKLYKLGHAGGGTFTIPAGFPNDSYPLGGGHFAQSGEVVTVTPKGKSKGGLPTIGPVNIYNGMDEESFRRMLMKVLRQ